MDILFFTMSMGRGGAERVIANLANNYAASSNRVTIATCQNQRCQYALAESITLLSLDRNEGRQNKITRFIRRRNKFKKILKEKSFDIIICFLPEPSFIMLSLKKQFRLKVIVSERWDPAQEYSKLTNKLMMNMLYPLADGFVFQTAGAQGYFKSRIRKNSIIIPNPIHESFLNESYEPNRKKEIVSVGRLYPQKNHLMLIEAFAQVHAKLPDYVLKIYGEGSLRQTLQMKIDKLGLEQSVFLMGEEKNIKEAIKRASVFVLSSDSEGLPNALMEAMCLGIPVISTDCPCGGPRFLIQNGVNGLLTETGNAEKLAEKILLLLENPLIAKKIAIKAMDIVEIINPEQVYSLWNDYIQNIYLINGD